MLQSLLALIVIFGAILGFHYVCIVAHELGHLIAAITMGWKPFVMKIGVGSSRTLMRFGDLHVQLGIRPSGGWVRATGQSLAWFRGQWLLFALAGPMMSLLAVWAIFALLALPSSRVPFSNLVRDSLLIAAILQIYILAWNLWPRDAVVDGMLIPTDGKQAWKSLFASREEIQAQFLAHAMIAATIFIERGEWKRVPPILERAYREAGIKSLDMHCLWIHCLLHQSKHADVDTAINELLNGSGALGVSRTTILDGIACISVFHDFPDFIPQALACIDEAIALEPDTITLKGTKASLLVESGRLEEGLKLLEDVMKDTKSSNDCAICSYYTALVYRRLGNWEEGKKLLQEAEQKYPVCSVKKRVMRLFWEPWAPPRS